MAEKIVIPEQFYVNYSMRGNSYFDYDTCKHVNLKDSKLGFATYQENNAAFRKRQTTIENWAGQDFKGKGDSLPNTARSGFKLGEMTTHGGGWNDTSTYWRVVDPTGFELEISSGNVAKLFQYCSIDKGQIAGECVWGWDKANGSKPVLIPCNSQLYVQAKKTSDVHHAASLALNDIKIGDYVELKNDTKGIFYGKVTVGYYKSSTAPEDHYEMVSEQTYCFLVDCPVYKRKKLYFMNTPKIIKVESREAIDKETAEKTLNNILQNRKDRYGSVQTASSNKHDLTYNTVYISYNGPQQTSFKLTPIETVRATVARLSNLNYSSNKPEQRIIAVLKSGQKMLITSIEQLYHGQKLPEDFTVMGHLINDMSGEDGLIMEKNPSYNKELRYNRETFYMKLSFKVSAIEEAYFLNIAYGDFTQKVFM